MRIVAPAGSVRCLVLYYFLSFFRWTEYVAQRTSACVVQRTWTYVGLRTSAYVVQRMLAYVKLRFFNESHAFRRFSLLFAATVVVHRCTPCTVLYYVVLTYLQHRTA